MDNKVDKDAFMDFQILRSIGKKTRTFNQIISKVARILHQDKAELRSKVAKTLNCYNRLGIVEHANGFYRILKDREFLNKASPNLAKRWKKRKNSPLFRHEAVEDKKYEAKENQKEIPETFRTAIKLPEPENGFDKKTRYDLFRNLKPNLFQNGFDKNSKFDSFGFTYPEEPRYGFNEKLTLDQIKTNDAASSFKGIKQFQANENAGFEKNGADLRKLETSDFDHRLLIRNGKYPIFNLPSMTNNFVPIVTKVVSLDLLDEVTSIQQMRANFIDRYTHLFVQD